MLLAARNQRTDRNYPKRLCSGDYRRSFARLINSAALTRAALPLLPSAPPPTPPTPPTTNCICSSQFLTPFDRRARASFRLRPSKASARRQRRDSLMGDSRALAELGRASRRNQPRTLCLCAARSGPASGQFFVRPNLPNSFWRPKSARRDNSLADISLASNSAGSTHKEANLWNFLQNFL